MARSFPWGVDGLIDISVSLGNDSPGYPGDRGFRRHLVKDMVGPEGYRLSSFACSSHFGTHVDAPAHFLAEGATIDQLPVDYFCGPALVQAASGPALSSASVKGAFPRAGEFLLFKTSNSRRWAEREFDPDYAALDLSGAQALIEAGVRGVGVDYLSVGRPDCELEVHRLLLGAGLAIIEGLNLGGVSPGRYELICLPLRLAGAEGAPARAVLSAR